MTPFQRGVVKPEQKAVIKARIQAIAKDIGCSYADAKKSYQQASQDKIWINDTYQVNIDRIAGNLKLNTPDHMHLSIKRRDKEPTTY